MAACWCAMELGGAADQGIEDFPTLGGWLDRWAGNEAGKSVFAQLEPQLVAHAVKRGDALRSVWTFVGILCQACRDKL